MILQIQTIIDKLIDQGILGIVVVIISFAVYKLYSRNMTLVERTLKMYEEEKINAKENEDEYKEFLKNTIQTQTLVIDRNTKVIEEYTKVHKELLELKDRHLNCFYNSESKKIK